MRLHLRLVLWVVISVAWTSPAANGQTSLQTNGSDPLPSWNEGAAKRTIVAFVVRTTSATSPDFVPKPERIATFDNDGTLWVEQPVYAELAFAIDRVKELAPQHPEWKRDPALAAVLRGDLQALESNGERGLLRLMMVTHAGMSTTQFAAAVSRWTSSARQPRFHRLYTDCVYEPMLELLAYLRANGFKTYIVSGGGVEFMRPWTERTYGVPPEQVIGSSVKTVFRILDGTPVLTREPQVDFVDDGPGKPVGIEKFIGRRPVAAFGNSDGDLQMLEWTAAGSGARLMLLVHHTDAQREYAYDRDSAVGKLDKALTEAQKRGWVVVDMKRDWKVVFKPVQ